jgi:hypothetical protein
MLLYFQKKPIGKKSLNSVNLIFSPPYSKAVKEQY